MQREEKQFEVTIESVLTKLNEIKLCLISLVHRIETETDKISFPEFLDNYALISSHLTGLAKVISKDMCPPLRNRSVLPLLSTHERDESLVALTEGRVPVFSADVIPNYLRTKPDPLTEQRFSQIEQKAASITAEAAMKQIAQYNKVVSNTMDIVVKAIEEWDVETSSRTAIQQSSSLADTHALIAAVGMGKGLKMTMPMNVPSAGPGGMMVPPVIRGASPMNPVTQPNVGPMGKAIKTNIKSAMQVHSFSRCLKE